MPTTIVKECMCVCARVCVCVCVTGAYGPLLCGMTSVLFGGVPLYPDPSRVWQIIEKHK